MAPEMALGETVDGRADLYALGCVAYYLLTGTAGVRGRHADADDVAAPAGRAGAALGSRDVPIPPALDQLVLACLAKDPEDRIQTPGS